jgi:hypothetical protein
LRRRSAARRCGGTPRDPSPVKYFLQQSTSGYLRAVTLARKSSQRVPKHLGGTIHDVGLPVADVERRTRFKRMRFASAWPIWFACPVCARSQRHLRYEYHRHQSIRSTHHRRRQHGRLHPAAVGSLLQMLIARIRTEIANTALLVKVHGKGCLCRSGGSGLIPSPGRSA